MQTACEAPGAPVPPDWRAHREAIVQGHAVWALHKLPQTAEIAPDDEVKKPPRLTKCACGNYARPGETLKAITAPGLALLGIEDRPDWEVVPEVPEPKGLYPYLAELDHWAASEPMDEPFLAGLLLILKYGEAELAEYKAGRSGLWGLVPPIEAAQVADANLNKEAAAALGLGVVVWGCHALARYVPNSGPAVPPMLQQAAEIVAALTLVLDIGNAEASSVVSPSLHKLGLEFEARGANALSALDDRRAAIVEAHRSEVLARHEAERHKTALAGRSRRQ